MTCVGDDVFISIGVTTCFDANTFSRIRSICFKMKKSRLSGAQRSGALVRSCFMLLKAVSHLFVQQKGTAASVR